MPTGRERKRLTPRFRLGTIQIEDRLVEKIANRYEDADSANFRVGELLWRHAAGIWGPVSDRALNDFVLRSNFPLGHDRWVVSRHVAVDEIQIEIATNLTAGVTNVRSCHP